MKLVDITVCDAAQILPLREIQTEDGPRVVPCDQAYMLEGRTSNGEIYLHFHRFPFTTEGRKAVYSLRNRIHAAGSEVSNEYWSFWRNEYGSRAYENEVIDVLLTYGNFQNAEQAGVVI